MMDRIVSDALTGLKSVYNLAIIVVRGKMVKNTDVRLETEIQYSIASLKVTQRC